MTIQCDKCHKQMDEGQFYLSKEGTRMTMCKKCLTMHVDNFDPSTFTWILQKLDFPYVQAQWNVLRDRAYAKNPTKMNGMSVIGVYLSKMRLSMWKKYTWKDSEMLQQQAKEKQERRIQLMKQEQERYNQEMKDKLQSGKISQAEFKTLTQTEFQKNVAPTIVIPPPEVTGINNQYNEAQFVPQQDLAVDYSSELTKEDKIYLAMKWGRLYKLSQLVQLQRQYTQTIDAFGIQDPDTTASLILLCKTSLKMNQAIDCGDIEGYQKLSRAYDSLRKSMKITAVQKKQKQQDFVDCVGLLVSYCEQHGGAIPRYDIKTNPDIIDAIIADMKEYNRSLIYEDTSIARQIQDYIKRREIAQVRKKDIAEASALGRDVVQVSDADHQAYFEMLQQQRQQQQHLMNGGE